MLIRFSIIMKLWFDKFVIFKLKLENMKAILIDNLLDDSDKVTSKFNVEVDGSTMSGYQVAKPMNYNCSIKTRTIWAKLIMEGKAIAVQYFEDLTKEEQTEYAKSGPK